MTYLTREEWGARRPTAGPGALDTGEVEGIAIHWPAMARPLSGIAEVSDALRGWQAYHMDGKGWSDIAYQEAVDQDGNVYELRGLTRQSAANGDADVNERFGALLLVLAPGELPTPAMMRSARARIAKHRTLFPYSRRVVGHGQIRPEPTQCPGPITQRLIDADRFEPVNHQEDEVTQEDIAQIAEAVAKAVRRETLPGTVTPEDADGKRIGETLSILLARTERIERMLKGQTSGPEIEIR